jgi:hypothetical protein
MASLLASAGPRQVAACTAGVLAIALSIAFGLTDSARAAETLYWDNFDADPDSVSFANVDGSGGGSLGLPGVTLKDPEGMAYDSVTDRLFVANSHGGPSENGEIVFLGLDGSGAGALPTPGAPVEVPEGIAVDPAARKVYWVNSGNAPSVAWARLDGSGGGMLNTSGATLSVPRRIALDPEGGRVYWANSLPDPQVISYANTDNSGGGDLSVAGATPPKNITGLSVDPAGGRVYWLENGDGGVSFASLAGGGGGGIDPTGAVFNNPYGLAFDPQIGRLYWGNYNVASEGAGAIGFLNVGGGGGGVGIATAPVDGPQDPLILKSPTGTGAPAIVRSPKSRSSLSCSAGGWGADYPGSFVYQAPRAFAYQWTRNGVAIAGATATTFNAKSAGGYACVVTASNQTGSASQASAAIKVKSAKVKLSVKRKVTVKAGGLAKFKVKGVNQGDIQSRKARVCVKLPKNGKGVLKAPKCKTLGKLKGRGKHGATLRVKVGKSATGTYAVKFLVRGSPGKPATGKILVK